MALMSVDHSYLWFQISVSVAAFLILAMACFLWRLIDYYHDMHVNDDETEELFVDDDFPRLGL